MKKNNNVIRTVTGTKLFWIVVSVLISISIWLYVTSLENDMVKRTFNNVPVELVGESVLRNNRNLVITELSTGTVSLEITGPRRLVGTMKAEDLKALVNVSTLTQSTYTSLQYSVSFPEGTNETNLSISAKYPEFVTFLVSKNVTKTVQVRGSFDGSPAEGYTAEKPVFEPATITISGPDAYLKNISYAWVTFGQNNVSSTYSEETVFTLMNENGEECARNSYMQFSTETVVATLPIMEVKDVPLTVNIIPGAGATEENVKITVEPASITLAGDSAILDGLNKIILGSVDLKTFTTSYSDTYTIVFDNELKNLTGVTEAKVTVELFGLATKTFRINNITCINITPGYSCEIRTENLLVSIRGSEADIEALREENLRAVADIDDYKESVGSYSPQVKIFADGFPNVGAMGEYTISIDLRKDTEG